MSTFTPVQAQAFLLYGSGVIVGNTTMVLSSFTDINGVALTMASFGTTGTGTVEPSSGASEEQILFTGVTQNADGTATLTGISSVGFKTPYTQTSGFLKNHAGYTTFVLSDTAYLYSQYASLSNTQTLTGLNTFTQLPTIPLTPLATTDAASKGYVDSGILAGAAKATTTVYGISELSVAPVTASVPIAVGDNDTRVPTQGENDALVGDNTSIAVGTGNKFVTQTGLQQGSETYATSTGSANAYVLTLSPVPTALVAGQRFSFLANFGNTGAATLNVNSLGAKNIYKVNGATALASGDIASGQLVTVAYDGTQFQLLSPIANLVTIPYAPYTTGFGAWTSASADGNGHQVSTDGFIVVLGGGSGQLLYTDSNATPTTERCQCLSTGSACMPVKKNDYYKVTTGPSAIFWIPIS